MEDYRRTIRVFKNHFWDFYNAQPKKVQDRIDWTIDLVRRLRIVPKMYFDHMSGTDGLWEIRTQRDRKGGTIKKRILRWKN